MPTINIKKGAGAGGTTGGAGGADSQVFRLFRKWLSSGSTADLDALISAGSGFPNIGRFFGLAKTAGQGRPGVGGGGGNIGIARTNLTQRIDIKMTGGTQSNAAVVAAIKELGAKLDKLVAVSSGEAEAVTGAVAGTVRKRSTARRRTSRFFEEPPILLGLPESITAGSPWMRKQLGAAVAGSPWQRAPGLLAALPPGGAWTHKIPIPLLPGPAPRRGLPPPGIIEGHSWFAPPPLSIAHSKFSPWWTGGGLKQPGTGFVGAYGVPMAYQPWMSGGMPPPPPPGGPGGIPLSGFPRRPPSFATINQQFQAAKAARDRRPLERLGNMARMGGTLTELAVGLGVFSVAAGLPWARFSMNAQGLPISAGLPYGRWMRGILPTLGIENKQWANLGITPVQGLAMLQAFPGYTTGSVRANLGIVSQLGEAAFMPGFSMMPAGERNATSALAFRYGLMGGPRGGIAAQMSRWQNFYSGQLTAIAQAGSSVPIFNNTMQSVMAGFAAAEPGRIGARSIASAITPFFNAGIGPQQAGSAARQYLAGPLGRMNEVGSNQLVQYGMIQLSEIAAKSPRGLATVIGQKGLVALQATTGGKSLIQQWHASVKSNGASSPVSTALLGAIMRTAYPSNPGFWQADWKQYLAPAFGANSIAGMGMLGASWWQGVQPEVFAFGGGNPLSAVNMPKNNPLNIKTPDLAGFMQYPSIGAGFKAADQLLLNTYWDKWHLNTIAGIVSTWNGKGAANNPQYISLVAKQMGVKANAPLNMTDPAVRARLEAAMALEESGLHLSPSDVYADIWAGGQIGSTRLARHAPPWIISYTPRAEALGLGASEAMAGVGGIALTAADKTLEALTALIPGLIAAVHGNTDALDALGKKWDKSIHNPNLPGMPPIKGVKR